jgi:hypothetical protein
MRSLLRPVHSERPDLGTAIVELHGSLSKAAMNPINVQLPLELVQSLK